MIAPIVRVNHMRIIDALAPNEIIPHTPTNER